MKINDKRNNSGQIIVLAAIIGALGVILGAFGAHALKASLENREMTSVWDTAVKYQLFHAVALLALAGWVEAKLATLPPESKFGRSAWRVACWFAVGIILFSGSLYLLALGAPTWLGIVTPFGGLALIIGWICLAVCAVRL